MRASAPLRWIPSLVLAGGLLVTSAAAYALHRANHERDLARFESAVASAQDRIQARLDAYVEVLLGVRGLFAANPSVEGSEFRSYVEQLDVPRRYPGILGVGFCPWISPGELDGVEAEMRGQGYAQFRVWPSPKGEELAPVIYLEPAGSVVASALGYDMASEPVRRGAMARARDTGLPAASGKVRLVRDLSLGGPIGFLIYVPIYRSPSAREVPGSRENLAGFVFSPLHIDHLLAGIFGSEREHRVTFDVYDGLSDAPEGLLHSSRFDDGGGAPYRPQFSKRLTFDVVGTPWTVAFSSTPVLDRASSERLVPYIWLAGALTSVLLFLITRSQLRARAEAEAQRNNLHSLFMQAPAAIAILRYPDLRYELSNPLNQEMASGRALVGKTVKEALPEFEAQGLLAVVERVATTGEPFLAKEFPVKLEGERDTGQVKYLNGICQPLRGPSGAIEGVMAFAYEVTDLVLARTRAEASEQNFRFLAETVPQLVWTSLPGGYFDYCNENWTTYTGIDLARMQGTGWTGALHPDDVERTLSRWARSQETGEPYESIFRFQRVEDGTYRWFISRALPLKDAEGRIVKWFGTCTDIDDEKLRDQERERLLEDLRQAVRIRDEFLSIAGHELRTPLTALQLQMQSLRRQIEKDGASAAPARAVDKLDKAIGHIGRLGSLVSQLLDVSRITSGKLVLDIEDVDVMALIAEVVERFQEQLSRVGCELSIRGPARLVGRWDRIRLDQVLTNLLANAIKYGPGKPIEIAVAEAPPDRAVISVRDYGIGIAAEDKARIFGRFERAVSERHYGGLGLGLWISRQIVETLGGSIAFESAPSVGTTFVVDLPVARPDREGYT